MLKNALNTDIENIYNNQINFFSQQKTLPIKYRREVLKKLLFSIRGNEKKIHAALYNDLRKSGFESLTTETILVEKEIKKMIKMLPVWSRAKRVSSSLLNFPSRDFIVPEPYGNVLIITPWNYPFQLAMTPLVGAVAAGNTVVLKPSESSENTSLIVSEIINSVFDSSHVSVIQGDASVASTLLKKRWDYIFYTGSTAVGKIVAKAAAENLTPTTLELGGKSPCIIDETVPIKKTAKRIVWSKYINCGQTCIAPDYLVVQKNIKSILVNNLINEIKSAFGKNPINSPDYGRIIHKKHFDKLKLSLKNQKILYGGIQDEKQLYFGPTLVDEPPNESILMQEEIFGPILPIISFDSENQMHQIFKGREKPLAFYIFSNKKRFVNNVFKRYSFGGGVANDAIVHFANDNLPFGGVGNSGMGEYHGKYSFKIFSHYKPIVKRSFLFDLPQRYAPYPKSLSFLKFLINRL